MSLTLVSYFPNPRASFALYSAALNGVKVEAKGWPMGKGGEWEWDIEPKKLDTPIDKPPYKKSERFTKLSVFGTAPALFKSDGSFGMSESVAMGRYVARLGNDAFPLLGKTPEEEAHINMWIDASQNLQQSAAFVYTAMGYMEKDAAHRTRCSKQVLGTLSTLEDKMLGPWLAGEQLTFADINLVVNMHMVNIALPEGHLQKAYPRLAALLDKFAAMPELQEQYAKDKAMGDGIKGKVKEMDYLIEV